MQVPAQYASMPLLKGRATIELTVRYIDNPRVKEETMTIVVDGLNAPVTAGNFVDLVDRKFYNGLKIDRSDGFVVQTGDPEGPEVGFVDPSTGKLRTIPLEVSVVPAAILSLMKAPSHEGLESLFLTTVSRE